MLVQIKPGLREVWRAPGTVQIGVRPGRGTLLEGLTEHDRELIARLRGGLDPVGLPDRAQTLLDLLAEGGVLVRSRSGRAALTRVGGARQRLAPDAAAWALVHPTAGDGWELLAARTGRVVEVRGVGRTADALAAVLAEAGVGVTRTGARLAARDGRGIPDAVVLVDRDAADAGAADALLRLDVPHLSVVLREGDVVVRPLVVPGRSPCLRCLDLHRSDRDPGWPRVLAQLLCDPGPGGGAGTEEAASCRLAASLAALQLLGLIDGLVRPAALGATLEVDLPDGLVSRRPWPAHAACGCTWPPGPPDPPDTPDSPDTGQDGRSGRRPGRMGP